MILNDFLVLQFRKKIGIFIQDYLYVESFKSNSKTVHYGNSNTLLFYQIYKDPYFSKTLWFIITILQIQNFALELIFPNKSIYFKDPMVKNKDTLKKNSPDQYLKRIKRIFNNKYLQILILLPNMKTQILILFFCMASLACCTSFPFTVTC